MAETDIVHEEDEIDEEDGEDEDDDDFEEEDDDDYGEVIGLGKRKKKRFGGFKIGDQSN